MVIPDSPWDQPRNNTPSPKLHREPGNFGFQANNSPKLLFPFGVSGAADPGRKFGRTEGTTLRCWNICSATPRSPSWPKASGLEHGGSEGCCSCWEEPG